MFKQVKSALFWYYLYKFRRRVILIFLLLLIALFSNAIYSDIIEYLKLKDKLQYLEIIMLSKWFIILFNLSFSVYLVLTIFKSNKDEKEKVKKEKELKKQEELEIKKKKQEIKKEAFSQREKELLYKKKLNSKADKLVNR